MKFKLKKGDKVSLPSSAFDGDDPGSFSSANPEPCVGHVLDIKKNGIVTVRWEDEGGDDQVRMKHLKLEARKANIIGIIVMIGIIGIDRGIDRGAKSSGEIQEQRQTNDPMA